MDTKRYDLSTDNTLGGNNASHSVSPSQKAIKEYVDSHSGGGSSIIIIDHIIVDNSVTTHPFYTYSNDETAYSLEDEQFYVYSNGAWTVDSSKTGADGMVIFCNEDEAFYQYEVQHKLKSLSRGVPYIGLHESDPDYNQQICIPACDSVGTIQITNNSHASTSYNLEIVGQNNENYCTQQIGHFHTINIINESSNNIDFTLLADGYAGNNYQHMYSGVDNNDSFTVNSGEAAEISVQILPYYVSAQLSGGIPNVIVKTGTSWTVIS